MNLLDRLDHDGYRPKREAGTHGGEYSCECPFCGGHDRFRVWPNNGDGGGYWCRGCGKSGDTIQYLRDRKGMTYREACLTVGRESRSPSDRGNHPSPRPSGNWVPKETLSPESQWQTKAGLFLDTAEKKLWSDSGKPVREYLRSRGLSEETIRIFRLGWNPKDDYRDYRDWGLPERRDDQGRVKKLWLPTGIVIPLIRMGKVERIRVRRQEGDPRYYLVPGSSMTPLVAGRRSEFTLVVESELDALLLHQEAGDLVTVVAMGSAGMRPDLATYKRLLGAKIILLSLDSDAAGARESWTWWKQQFAEAKRWPVISGKDPTEAFQNGLSLRNWVLAGIVGPEIKTLEKNGINMDIQMDSLSAQPIRSVPVDESPKWVALMESDRNPESIEDEDESVFLQGCQILREAETMEKLNARWRGQRKWFAETLPEQAIVTLDKLYSSLLAELAGSPG